MNWEIVRSVIDIILVLGAIYFMLRGFGVIGQGSIHVQNNYLLKAILYVVLYGLGSV